ARVHSRSGDESRRSRGGHPARRRRHRGDVPRQICNAHDVLFAADEVITGFGRTGKWCAREHWGVAPDLIQFAKAITSGYVPFGGFGMSDDIARAIDRSPTPWMHAFTYSAHPVGCAVALRTLQIIDEENLVAAEY